MARRLAAMKQVIRERANLILPWTLCFRSFAGRGMADLWWGEEDGEEGIERKKERSWGKRVIRE